MIAVAWADGKIQTEEIACLKDLLFYLPSITHNEILILNSFLESPLSSIEKTVLIDNLLNLISTQEEKDFTIYALEKIIQADGLVTRQELNLLNMLKASLYCKRVRFLQKIERFTREALSIRISNAHKWLRDKHLEHFIQTKKLLLQAHSILTDVPELEIRKIFLTGILLGRATWINDRVTDLQITCILSYIQQKWDLAAKEALLLTRCFLDPIANDLSTLRVSRELYDQTSQDERITLLGILVNICSTNTTISKETYNALETLTYQLKLDIFYLENHLNHSVKVRNY